MKQAILILAHNNWELLDRLINFFEPELFDIYVHIDKKAFKSFKHSEINQQKAHASFFSSVSVKWGDYSQVKAELALFSRAFNRNKYSYYHLLSGVDFPLKNSKDIFAFFEKNYPQNFIEFSYLEKKRFETKDELLDQLTNSKETKLIDSHHIKYYRPFQGINFFSRSSLGYKLNDVAVRLQKLMGINRLKKAEIHFAKGSNWVSFTDQFVAHLLIEKEQEYLNRSYKFTFGSDEVYKQTIFLNSEFVETIYFDETIGNQSNLRVIDWNRGMPFTFFNENLEEIKHLVEEEKYLFIRKLDQDKSSDLIDYLNNQMN
ncbi:MAG: beta-1,6-N-acetylglucosaminyltransferase [Enterococcus sp.]